MSFVRPFIRGAAVAGGVVIDPLALDYFTTNSITDESARSAINASLTYLRSVSLLPDDAFFLRSGQQPSAAAPVTLKGLVGGKTGAPTLSALGASFDGDDAYNWTLPAAVTSFTVVGDIQGVTTGQTAYGNIVGLTNATSGNTATDQTLLYANDAAVQAYSKEGGAGTLSDNTFVSPITEPQLLDTNCALEVFVGYAYEDAASPTVTIWSDGKPEIVDSSGMTRSTSALNRLQLAARWSAPSSYALFFKGRQAAWLLYARVLSDAEMLIATRALRILDPRQINLVAFGDSLSANVVGVARAGDNWPLQFGKGSSHESVLRVVSCAIGGKTAAIDNTEYAARVTRFKPDGIGVMSAWLTVLAGTNDLLDSLDSAETVAANIAAICAKGRVDGFKILLMTIPPSNEGKAGVTFDGAAEARRVAINTLLLEEYTAERVDAFVDLNSINAISAKTNDFWQDSIHFNVHGNKLISERIAAELVLSGVTIPRCSVRPVVSGTLTVGSQLSVTDGTWSETPFEVTYQWYREATPIVGATSDDYILVAGDATHRIFCRVTTTNEAGESQSASSDLTAAIT